MSDVKPKKKHKRVKKLIAWVVALALLGGAGYLFVWPQLAAGATTTYDQYTATRGTISNSLSFSGSIAVKNSETLSSEGAGTVRKLYVGETDSVQAGDRLVRLSTGETLKAGFDGQVNQLSVELGDEVAANATIIQIVDFEHLQVSFRVDEYDISSVSVGTECVVKVTALGQSFNSTVAHINRISSSSGSTAYYTVTADVSVPESVLPGMQATVTIPEEEAADAVILNKSALSFDRQNSAYVLTKDEETGDMVQTPVEIGVDNDNYVEITSGLAEGDTVYVVAKTDTSSSGLLSGLFSNIGGATAPSGGTMPDMSSMPGNRGTGGNFSGGFPGGNR